MNKLNLPLKNLFRLKPLSMTIVFMLATLVSMFGPMVPSAHAAMIWEDIPVTFGTNPITSGIVPQGATLSFSAGTSNTSIPDLSVYNSYKLSFDYTNQNMGVTSIDLKYLQTTNAGEGIGSPVKYSEGYPISATSGQVEAPFSVSIPSGNNFRLSISHGTGSGGNNYDPNSYPNRLDLTNIRLQGQKDDGVVVAPAVPGLVNPANASTVDYGDIQSNVAKFQVTPESGVVKTQITLTGKFTNTTDSTETDTKILHSGTYDTTLDMSHFASEVHEFYDFRVGNTYTWKARSSFSDIDFFADSGWGEWSSSQTFTVVAPAAPTAPVAPVLTSPIVAIRSFILKHQNLSGGV